MIDVKYEYGCEITSTSECPLRKEIRADAIDECIKEINYEFCENDEKLIPIRVVRRLKQLKEQNIK